MTSQEIKQAIVKLLDSSQKTPEDRLAESYLSATTIENIIKKERERIKSEIVLNPKAMRKLERAMALVEQTEISETLSLFSGKNFEIGAQVKNGGSFIDMEVLQASLNVSQKKWDMGISLAKQRRSPTVTLHVSKKLNGKAL